MALHLYPMKKQLQVFILVFCLITSCHNPPTFNDSTQGIVEYFNGLNATKGWSGQCVIVQDGIEILNENWGVANRNWDIPVQATTKFDIASINKSFVAAIALRAVEQHRINLDDRVDSLLAIHGVNLSFHPQLTLHHLLTHTGGIADYPNVSEDLKANNYLLLKRQHFSTLQYLEFIHDLPLMAEPGEEFYYSNFGYHLLTIILELSYQDSFQNILQQEVTLPLGLKNTISSIDNHYIVEHLALPYTWNKTKNQWNQTPYIDWSMSRRIFSTASDLSLWAQAFNAPGYLSKESLEAITTNSIQSVSSTISYGYGWVVVNDENTSEMGKINCQQPYIIHGGSTDGYKSLLVNIDQGNYIISLLSNTGSTAHEIEIVNTLLNQLQIP